MERTVSWERIEDLPETCGVYLFRDGGGGLLYIGKAVNLNRRVRQHCRDDRTRGRIRQVEWIPCATELHALLLEDILIKRYLPPYNRRQKDLLRRVFLAFDGAPFPTLRVIDRGEAAGREEVFGPFRSEYAAQETMETVCRYLHLRGCGDPLPFLSHSCLPGTLRRCSAPCLGRLTPARYEEIVDQARAFLLGEGGPVLREMEERMERLSRNLQFEAAGRVRDRLRYTRRMLARQRFHHIFRAGTLVVHSRAEWPGTFLFRNGRLALHTREILERKECRALIGMIGEERAELPACPAEEALFDQACIVQAWMLQDPLNRSFHVLEPVLIGAA